LEGPKGKKIMEFLASDIVGYTLFAQEAVELKTIPRDSAPAIETVFPGATVGVVTGWVDQDLAQDRASLYWMLDDGAGGTLWAKHEKGLYDLEALKEQGVITETVPDWFRYVQKILITVLVGYGVTQVVKTYINTRK
jgi:hypothetical protein